MKKRKKSDLAQKLSDSLLDDVEGMEVSYGAPPSETLSIGGLSPFDPKEKEKFKKAVAKAVGFIPSDGIAGESLSKSSSNEPEGTAAKLWTDIDRSNQPLKNSDPEKARPKSGSTDEKTMPIMLDPSGTPEGLDVSQLERALKGRADKGRSFDSSEKTVVAASAQRRKEKEPTTKVRFGAPRSTVMPQSETRAYASPDASLVQAESLKLAQERILQLENEVERLRRENEELASAGETLRDRADELLTKVEKLERSKKAQREDLENEMVILKSRLDHKDSELSKVKLKKVELENRLQRDFKKVRVRERELENRLELSRMENAALIRSKDETILDLKRRIDQLESEADAYRQKCQELNHQIDSNQDQFRRTVKALRLALTNLEVDDESLAPFKKAE